MALTTAALSFIAAATTGVGSPVLYSNANARIGVGDSATAFAANQTDLQAATNKFRKAMDATYPLVAGAVMTFKATFATGEANYAWQEWATFNDASAGTMLQRRVESLGTKTSAASWALTIDLTYALA
jgi:hypothetical protein